MSYYLRKLPELLQNLVPQDVQMALSNSFQPPKTNGRAFGKAESSIPESKSLFLKFSPSISFPFSSNNESNSSSVTLLSGGLFADASSICLRTLLWAARAAAARGNCGSFGSVSLESRWIISVWKKLCKQSQKCDNSIVESTLSWICGGV